MKHSTTLLPKEHGFYVLWKSVLDYAKSPPPNTVSEWADKNRKLSKEYAAEPGPYKTARVPFLKDIMDDLSDLSPVEEVIFQKPTQIGATEAGNNWLGYIMDENPGPTLLIMTSLDTVKKNSKQRIDPLIEATPALKGKVAEKRSKDASNSIFYKEFPGGSLSMVGSNSSAGLRSMPYKNIFGDEVSKWPSDIDGEGDPVRLARKRSTTFAKRKHFFLSTPLLAGKCRIEKEYLNTDQRKYKVPCPHCWNRQELIFDNLHWNDKKPLEVFYACEHCGEAIYDRKHKAQMIANGIWEPTNIEKISNKKKGYHINALYSPWVTWEQVVDSYLESRGKPTEEQDFKNNVLALTYEQRGDSPEWKRLYDRREKYDIGTLPEGACLLTAGADVQKDGIFVEIVAWGQDKESWSIDWLFFHGDTTTDKPWKELDRLMGRDFRHHGGEMMTIRNLAIDTGYNTKHVYNWCRKYPMSRVLPIKGNANQAIPISTPKLVEVGDAGKNLKRGLKTVQIGVNILKEELYGWLNLDIPVDTTLKEEGYPMGFCHFPQYDQEYFEQLTAEVIIEVIDNRGFPKYVWQKQRPRNEALDCRVYARAASIFLKLDRMTENDFMDLKDELYGEIKRKNAEKKTQKDNSGNVFHKEGDPGNILRRKSTFL